MIDMDYVIREKDVTPLFEIEDCRQFGGWRYLLSTLIKHIPKQQLSEFIETYYRDDEARRDELMNFIELHCKEN